MTTFMFESPFAVSPQDELEDQLQAAMQRAGREDGTSRLALNLRAQIRDRRAAIDRAAQRLREAPKDSISLRLPADLLVEIDLLADELELCRSALLRQIVYEFIQQARSTTATTRQHRLV